MTGFGDGTKSPGSDRPHGFAVLGRRNICCARPWKAACGASVARLWLPARLSLARADRMGTSVASRAGLLVWRPGLLPWALDRRWVRPVLDADTDWKRMELRPVVVSRAAHHRSRDRQAASLEHARVEARR